MSIEVFNHHTQVIHILQEHFGDKPIVGIELGTAEGLLTKGLLYYLPNLQMIYAIDPYIYAPERGFEAATNNQEWHDDRKKQAEVALAPYNGRYTHLCLYSDDAVAKTPDVVDFVWIDGDHTQSQVEKDIDNYYPKVRSGGVFGGHDIGTVFHTVYQKVPKPVSLGLDLTWWHITK